MYIYLVDKSLTASACFQKSRTLGIRIITSSFIRWCWKEICLHNQTIQLSGITNNNLKLKSNTLLQNFQKVSEHDTHTLCKLWITQTHAPGNCQFHSRGQLWVCLCVVLVNSTKPATPQPHIKNPPIQFDMLICVLFKVRSFPSPALQCQRSSDAVN